MPGIIDMRLRPPIPEWTAGNTFKTAMYYPRRVPGFPGARSAWTESMDELFKEMDEAGVTYGVVMGRSAFGELGGVGNSAIVNTVEKWPKRFVGFLGTDLSRLPEAIAELRDLARHSGIRGISIEPGSAQTPMHSDDSKLHPIYELCGELDLPVSISLSGLLSQLAGHDMSWASPISVQRVAMRYPKLKIIVSHAAWPWSELMVSIALGNENTYVSPDLYAATRSMPGARNYVDAANLYLGKRTLFGTAYPTRPLDDALRDFRAMGWRPDIIDDILWNNAASLLRIS
ncbi:MAG: amidohydrolase family protein [Hyphomicrobiaceae bacterium]